MRSAWQYISQYLGASEYNALNPEESEHSHEEELKRKLKEVENALSRIPRAMVAFFIDQLKDLEEGKNKIRSEAEKVLEALVKDIPAKKSATPSPKQETLPEKALNHKSLHDAIKSNNTEDVKNISARGVSFPKQFELSDKAKKAMLALEEEIIKTTINKFIIIYRCEAETAALQGAYVKLAEIIGQGVEFSKEADKLVEWMEYCERRNEMEPWMASFTQGMGESLKISNEYAKKGVATFGPDILPKFELKGDLADVLFPCSKLNSNNSVAEKAVEWLLESLKNYVEYEVKRIGTLQKPKQTIEAAIEELTPKILAKALPFDFTAIIEKAIADEDLGPPFNAASHIEVVPVYSSTSAAAAAAMPAYPSSPPQKIPTMVLDGNDDSVPSSDGRSPQSVEEDFMPFSPPTTAETQFHFDQ
jgi:hypothetical protein